MAYNVPSMYYPQSFYNSTSGYQPVMQQPINQQASYAQTQYPTQGIIWVDGEVGAKAYQIPAGHPANSPVPLWDTNDTIIWLKSMNPMGMPNPLQKIRYTMEDTPQVMLPAGGQSGNDKHENKEQYITREEFEKMKHELEDLLTAPTNTQAQNQTRKRGE